MKFSPLKLSTLAWIDRRRLWATADRKTALGFSKTPSHPISISGQSTRPTSSPKVFTFSKPLGASVLGLSLAAGYSATSLATAVSSLLALARNNALLLVDDTLNPTRGPALPTGTSNPPQMALRAPLGFSTTVFSLQGLMGLVEGQAPCPWRLPSVSASRSWASRPLSGGPSLWALCISNPKPGLPTFRPYLGEWRRLYDQTLAPTSNNLSASVTLSRSPKGAVAAPTLPNNLPGKPLQTLRANKVVNTKAYLPYLSSPWVF